VPQKFSALLDCVIEVPGNVCSLASQPELCNKSASLNGISVSLKGGE